MPRRTRAGAWADPTSARLGTAGAVSGGPGDAVEMMPGCPGAKRSIQEGRMLHRAHLGRGLLVRGMLRERYFPQHFSGLFPIIGLLLTLPHPLI